MATTCPNPREKWSVECRKRSLPSSPTAWVTCHGALESLGWPHGQIWTNYEKNHCISLQPNTHYIFIWETHGFWHILVQSSDAPSGSANDEIQRPPMVLPRCFQGVRWVGEIPRNQDNLLPNISKNEQQLHDYVTVTCNITCTVYRIMNARFLYIIAWLLDYRIVWWYIYIVSTPNSWTLVG